MLRSLSSKRARSTPETELLSSNLCVSVAIGNREFLHRLIELASSVRKPDHFARLSVGAKSDFEWSGFHTGFFVGEEKKDKIT